MSGLSHTQLAISDDLMKAVILDLLNDFCAHQHNVPPSLTEAAQMVDYNGKWLLDSLVTYQAATYVATMFGLPKDQEPFVLLEKTSLNEWAHLICEHVKNECPDIVFFTSGTTGKRKVVEHSLDVLLKEAEEWVNTIGDIEHIYINVPRHHIYGFIWGILIPTLVGCKVTDYRRSLLGQGSLSKNALIVSTPHAAPLLTLNPLLNTSDANIVLSTAPCDHQLLKDLKQAGYRNVYHVYGSTETGGIGFRTQDLERYTLCARISEQHGSLYRAGECLPLQDKLEFADNRHFSILSRFDSAIQIRGYNVNITNLEGLIAQHKYVHDVGIRVCGLAQKQYLEVFIQTSTMEHASQIAKDILVSYSNLIYAKNIHIVEGAIRNSMGKLILAMHDQTSSPLP